MQLIVLSTLIPVVQAQCTVAGGTGGTVFRAQFVTTNVTLLGMIGAGNRLANGALNAIRCADLVIAGRACVKMVSTELIGTKRTWSDVVGTNSIATVCAGLDIIGTDDRITDVAFVTVSVTDRLSTRLAGRQVLCSKWICTDITLVVMVSAKRVAALCTVGHVVRAYHIATSSTGCRIRLADTPMTRCARREVRIGELTGADLTG